VFLDRAPGGVLHARQHSVVTRVSKHSARVRLVDDPDAASAIVILLGDFV
jgi:hypothetical protein